MNNFNDNLHDFKEEMEKRKNEVKGRTKLSLRAMGMFIIALAIVIVATNFFYVVEEDEVATVRRFGKIVKVIVDKDDTLAKLQGEENTKFSDVEIVKDKGLFFKVPFITDVEKDSSKLFTYISGSANINTRDKIKYQIAMYAQWEISHPGIYSTALGSIAKANGVIDEVGYAAVIEAINSLTSREFLTDKEKLAETMQATLDKMNERLSGRGIVLRDIEVYRTILPESNIQSTYNKMIAEREAIAQQKRSEGLELYQNTVADTDREVAKTVAEAIETSEKIKGEADAEALEIYANAFSKDPAFYEYWRTLKSYEETIDENAVLFIDRDNAYLKYFTNPEVGQ